MSVCNVHNRTLFHLDNLEVLRGINSNCINLIATDPPFNKNKDFHATPESLAKGGGFTDRWSWERDIHQDWVDAIEDSYPAVNAAINAAKVTYGEDMAAFMCWLGVRLIDMHRVLRDDGSIYLHCDPTASHYIKLLMDAVFGMKNFRNEIIWKRSAGAKNNAKRFHSEHDVILYYSKTNNRVSSINR